MTSEILTFAIEVGDSEHGIWDTGFGTRDAGESTTKAQSTKKPQGNCRCNFSSFPGMGSLGVLVVDIPGG